MEEDKRAEERETEPETDQVGPAVQTQEEDKEIPAESAETVTELTEATPTLQEEKGKEKEDEGTVGPAVQGDEEKEAEVSDVEIVEEKKENIAGPIEVLTTELVGPAGEGLEAVVAREVVEVESGKPVEVTPGDNPVGPPGREKTTEVKVILVLFSSI